MKTIQQLPLKLQILQILKYGLNEQYVDSIDD